MKICKLIFFGLFSMLISCNSSDKRPETGDLDDTFKSQSDSTTNDQINPKDKLAFMSEGWQEEEQKNGPMPLCYNFNPEYGNIDNYLEVQVGSKADVSLKLIDVNTDMCVRYVYIRSGSTFIIRKVPEGKYYVKLAFGKNWISKINDGKCIGKFFTSPLYQKGKDTMEFSVVKEANGTRTMNYQLKLDVHTNGGMNSFSSTDITENEFNQ